MQPIFDFIGSYWWLAFPLMGVVGAFGGAWERGARRRHKRRLEVLHAKAELKAAARGQAVPAASLPPVTGATATTVGAPGSSRETQGTQLERLFATHDGVTSRWLDYELDVAKIIAFPAMSDGRQPLTAAFLRAKRIADGLRPASTKARLTKEQLAEYRNAVADFEVAFDIAERDARRLKDSSFSEVERKRLDTAKQLLSVAIDQAATPAERQLAYRRVRQELDGLISLSDEAIEVLESKVSLELAPGAQAAQPADAPKATDAPAPRVSTTPPPAAPAGAGRAAPQPAPEPLPAPWPVPARGSGDTAPGRVIHPKSHP
ncbi:hypothetical protein [Microbacterium sp. CFBP9034]|uniref:hypothetical protein n=1 Tax=Microbacterium sp. CFBP9034 TaxID=3096540 RepID=UPI002A6B01C3|nr:hypothetical protein [Microbacterium sp. CFBP9034]MDY0908043.1 hypothetical protein [Microbacterium sp. CFBP9034]